MARSEPGILVPADQWDAHPALLSVANSTLELISVGAKLRERRREDRLTKVARAVTGGVEERLSSVVPGDRSGALTCSLSGRRRSLSPPGGSADDGEGGIPGCEWTTTSRR